MIDTLAVADARADNVSGEGQLYRLMHALVAAGDVRPEAWLRYCQVYAETLAATA